MWQKTLIGLLNKLAKDLKEWIKKTNDKQDNTNLNNVRVLAFREKKIVIIIVIAAKCVVRKLLITLINAVLEREE